MVLQPGPQDGYDTWLTWKRNDPVITNWNWDTVAITAAYAWTSGGVPITGRSLIEFKGLSAIPAKATVISARLYMYGVENSPHLPAGNSVYKGSPYHEDNSMTVLRVTQNWDSKTVTWPTQPGVTREDAVVIPISTSQWNYDANVDVTPMVAKMVANPSANYGFMFRMAIEQIYKCMQFSSSNYYVPERRPKLVVTYR
ncbi:MAG: DNRLRE domain-containing protein [Parafilimonas sp.]|nr:DNRLRE domain-containing protein [Parafilimonas sp.]